MNQPFDQTNRVVSETFGVTEFPSRTESPILRSPADPPLLYCENLTKTYGGAPALDAINLTIYRGRIVGLLGPNGSGKTTLLKLIAGLLTPTRGRVLVKGFPIGTETKSFVSYMPERTYFDGSLSVSDTVSYFSDFYADFDRGQAVELIRRLGLPEKSKFKTLSKGMKEKLQLILVMSRRADLYLLDEPIAGVDPATRDFILDIVLNHYDRNATILLSTHLIYDIEPILDDIIMISGGRIFLADTCENLRNKTGRTVDQYFREAFRC